MGYGYFGLYIDSKYLLICKIKDGSAIIWDKYLWDKDYFKLDDTLEKLKKKFKRINVFFDENIDEYDEIHILDIFANKDIEIAELSHKFIALMLSNIFMKWTKKEEEIVPIGEVRNFLIMDLRHSDFEIGVISIENSVEKLNYKFLAKDVFDKVGTNLICKLLEDYIKHIKEYEVDDMNLSIFEYMERFNISNKEFERNVLSAVQANIKELIEEFYLNNKDILDEVNMDHIVLLGDFKLLNYLSNYILHLFNKKENVFLKEKDYYILLGSVIEGLLDKGENILPFDKQNISYAGEDIIFYQDEGIDHEYIYISERDIRCPYEKTKYISLGNTIKNPIHFKIAKVIEGEIEDIDVIDMYIPFSYYGDVIEIKINIDNDKKIICHILHDRTGEEISFELEL